MVFRLLMGVGLFAAGYYLGREMGRTEHIRKALEAARNKGGEQELPSEPPRQKTD